MLLVRLADEVIAFLPAGTLGNISLEFHLSYAEAGLLLALLPAGGVLGNLFTLAADYVSRRLLAAAGGAVVALSLLAFGLSPWFAGLCVASFTWGMASDALVSGAEVALVDVSGKHLTAALSRQNLLATIGDLLSPTALALAAAFRIGWRALFIGSAVAMFGYAGWLAAEQIPAPSGEVEDSPIRGLLSVLADTRVWLLAAAELLVALVDEPYLAFLLLFLERVRGASLPIATSVAFADLLGAAVGSYLAERLLGRRPGLWLVVCGAALPGVLVILLVTPALAIQYLAAALAGALVSVVWVALQGASLSLRRGQAGATRAVISWISLAGLAFPIVVGAVADQAGLMLAMLLYVGATILLAGLLVPISRIVNARRDRQLAA